MGRGLVLLAILAVGCAKEEQAATTEATPTATATDAPVSTPASKNDIKVNPNGNMSLPTKKL